MSPVTLWPDRGHYEDSEHQGTSDSFYDACMDFPPLSEMDASESEEDEKTSLNCKLPSEGGFLDGSSAFCIPYHTADSSSSSSDGELSAEEDGRRSMGNCMMENGIEDTTKLFTRRHNPQVIDSIQPAELVYPKSRYDGYVAPLPVSEECIVVEDLLAEIARQDIKDSAQLKSRPNPFLYKKDFLEFELSNFTIYLPSTAHHHAFEMRPLQSLASKIGHSCLLFDGVLSVGKERWYVQRRPFQVCSIGNYGEDLHEVGDNIWIKSDLNAKREIFYKLKEPATEYARFHRGFVWLADLAKHFVDYCQASYDMQRPVSVHNFRNEFSRWIWDAHEGSKSFQTWYQKHGKEDFRCAVSANINFLFKEAVGVSEDLRSHPIWSELLAPKTAVKKNEIQEVKTVVTPYVYDCFNHLRFGHHLKAVNPASSVEARRASQGKALHFTMNDTPSEHRITVSPMNNGTTPSEASNNSSTRRIDTDRLHERQQQIKTVKVGDVLSVTTDGKGSVWKDEVSRWKAADDCWYILVQAVHVAKTGKRSFDGIWLYKPSDTSCAKMKYPFGNELFMSDNCTCVFGRMSGRISEEEVIDVVTVAWHGNPSEVQSHFFVRQTYLHNEKFVTLRDVHKKCGHVQVKEKAHLRQNMDKYLIGDTVLVRSRMIPFRESKHALEPYEVVEYVQDGPERFVILRRLLRRAEIDHQSLARVNELVYTDKKDKLPPETIKHKCLVRCYSETNVKNRTIPTPYDRDGTGNAFYITKRLIEGGSETRLSPIEDDIPQTLIQGFDPMTLPKRQQLHGLDLYCGGGNFGRGLEEGGAVRNTWAVDLAENAIHTYHANLKDPASTKLFFGSVDDLLTQALQGNRKGSDLVPLPGQVDFISAGSPCQGFSRLNNKRDSEQSLKNQSLVASVAAYVDFYRPKYGLLENVMNMAQKGRGRDEDVLSQLVCAIVGMGYQVQLFVLDAWSFGSPQSRSRIFVSFAAPGCEPLEHPKLTHSHPPKVLDRGLGKLANGQSFGKRVRASTPFEYVTAGDATADLPRIGDGRTYQCTSYPDHVIARTVKENEQTRISVIPTNPWGMNFIQTYNDGLGSMTEAERELFPLRTKSGGLRQSTTKGSNAWGRINPQGLFPTVVVSICAEDARMGTCLHWDQHRYISLMEARRAQSFPDDEVLLGSTIDQWKIVGNSVARTVALALGLCLREAWLKNPAQDKDEGGMTKVSYALPPEIWMPAGLKRPSRRVLKSSASRLKGPIRGLAVGSSYKTNVSDLKSRRSLDSASLNSSETLSYDEMASSISSPGSDDKPENLGKFSKRQQSIFDKTEPLMKKMSKISNRSPYDRRDSSQTSQFPTSFNDELLQAQVLNQSLNHPSVGSKLQVVIIQKKHHCVQHRTVVDGDED